MKLGTQVGLLFIVAVVIEMFAIVEFHGVFVQPAAAELARQRGDSLDGETIVSLGLIMVGWIPPLVMTLIFSSICGQLSRESIGESERQ